MSLADSPASGAAPASSANPASSPTVARVRQWVGVTCSILCGLLIAPTVFGSWTNHVLVNEERYMALVSPLSSDPAVQQAVSGTASGAIDAAIEALPIDSLIPNLPGPIDELINGLGTKATDAATAKVDETAQSFVQSPQFASSWDTINRKFHAGLVQALGGDNTGVLTINDGTMAVDTGVIVEGIRDALVDRGLTILQNAQIPELVDKQIPIASSDRLGDVQAVYQFEQKTSGWMPWFVAALGIAGILIAVRRGMALLWLGVLGTAGLLVSLLVVAAVGPGIGNAITPGPLEPAVQAIVSVLIGSLRTWILIAGAVTLLLAVAGWLLRRNGSRPAAASAPAAPVDDLAPATHPTRPIPPGA